MPPFRTLGSAVLVPVLVSLGACGLSDPEIRPSSELRALLLTENDYPSGYELEPIDHDELNDSWSSFMPGDEFDDVSPSECADLLGTPVEMADSYNVEGHAAVNTGSPYDSSIFSQVLMSGGDVGEASLRGDGFDELEAACSDARITVEGEEGDMRIAPFELEGMPDDFLGINVTISVEQVDVHVRMAMTLVDDVMIAIHEVDIGGGPSFPLPDVSSSGEDTLPGSFQDYQEEREAAEATLDEEDLAEIQDLMSRSVEKVRER
ncbi:hypothetical protein J4H86_16640 [Spiractinospora alimapuensis]|uniref:hypothetical protein n=1 Tax=Spiractinospora alimapuensis TaxID=2820884 RepID=UPI001F33E137|nr:hypothetical protein [Spiractinospora alimapuensis]QVQ50528.1 hypothetical protein J4H86_16640 [Spiractinospora alimapuensis]